MDGILSSWKVVRRFLYRTRRDFKKRRLRAERNPTSNLSKTKRRSKKIFLFIIFAAIICCLYFLHSQYIYTSSMEVSMDYLNNNDTAENMTSAEEVVTRRINQVAPPRQRPNISSEQMEKLMHIAFAKRQLALMRIRKLLKEHKNYFTPLVVETTVATTTSESTTKKLPYCFIPKNYSGLSLNMTDVQSLEGLYPMIQDGGYYRPSSCVSRHKLAIVVPYRNRPKNLSTFIFNIHPFLMNQNLEYRIFLIEQAGDNKFNKGRLFNAGFKEAKKYGLWKCVMFHDVDLLPTTGQILYTCPRAPRHMSSAVYDLDGNLAVNTTIPLFGGVTAMTMRQYEKVNGHSNLYWGWGGEDIDMYHRLRAAPLQIGRYDRNISIYIALPHEHEKKNPRRYVLLSNARERFESDGLNTVQYKVQSATVRHLYTHIVVDVTSSDAKPHQYDDYFFQNGEFVT